MARALARGRVEDLEALIAAVRRRSPRALGRAISLCEDGGPDRERLIRRVYPLAGRARLVGVTGPPGAGKSTLVDRLARHLRGRDETVGILAVDPTSPYSGGAILGDRVRMQTLYTDPAIYIRSMATRGEMGGLARATHDAVDVLDAAGFDWVLVETVGVGQDEVDVVRSVDTVVVVTLPGLGDDIQAIKAGILEIADVFVINKADQPGADRAAHDLEMMLGLGEGLARKPPILKTVASRNEGVGEVVAEIEAHREWLVESGELERRRRINLRLRVEAILKQRVLEEADRAVGLERELASGFAEHEDPYRVAERLFAGAVGRVRAAGAEAAHVAADEAGEAR